VFEHAFLLAEARIFLGVCGQQGDSRFRHTANDRFADRKSISFQQPATQPFTQNNSETGFSGSLKSTPQDIVP
jgi:hypothetical protein